MCDIVRCPFPIHKKPALSGVSHLLILHVSCPENPILVVTVCGFGFSTTFYHQSSPRAPNTPFRTLLHQKSRRLNTELPSIPIEFVFIAIKSITTIIIINRNKPRDQILRSNNHHRPSQRINIFTNKFIKMTTKEMAAKYQELGKLGNFHLFQSKSILSSANLSHRKRWFRIHPQGVPETRR